MSYAGPARARKARPSTSRAAPDGGGAPAARSTKTFGAADTDWRQVAIFGAGLAFGILLGGGIALLTAPQTGDETRDDLRRGARRATGLVGRKSRGAWLDLRDELRRAARGLHRRKVSRADRALQRELSEPA